MRDDDVLQATARIEIRRIVAAIRGHSLTIHHIKEAAQAIADEDEATAVALVMLKELLKQAFGENNDA